MKPIDITKSSHLPTKLRCIYCNGMAILMEDRDGMSDYYYHYSFDYKLGCHQRISLDSKEKMKSLTIWTKDDEIRELKEVINGLSTARDFWFSLNIKSIKHPKIVKLIKWWVNK